MRAALKEFVALAVSTLTSLVSAQVVTGDTCQVRTLNEMIPNYQSGLISLSPGQVLGFSYNWRYGGLSNAFDKEPRFASGKALISLLDHQYAADPTANQLLSLHLSLKTAQVWVMTSDIRSGSMTPVPVQGPESFAAAAMFIDRFLCTTHVAAKASVTASFEDLTAGYKAIKKVQANPYVLPGVQSEFAAAYFDSFNQAKPDELEKFKKIAPIDFEKVKSSNQVIRAEFAEKLPGFKANEAIGDVVRDTESGAGVANFERFQSQKNVIETLKRAQIRGGALN